jgi:methylenetetrahydrofolate dehydrogenase (NADP+) / methenyltetrahydrofolate cyclohydrolase
MTAKIIDGKTFAENLRKKIAEGVGIIKEKYGITPGLAVILVGEDPASQVYVKNKGKQTLEVGMNSYEFKMPVSVSQGELIDKISELNLDKNVNGILVQLPLPKAIDERAIINTISPEKDVDGFHVINVGKLSTDQTDGMIPCTPLGCMMLLKDVMPDLGGKKAVVIGRSNIVGKPIAQLLLRENCTVTIAHSRTFNLANECKRADIIISAVGVEEMVRGDWVKSGAVIIDVGINRVQTCDGNYKLVGDVCFKEVSEVAGAITPVPGGVGPMTIACLLSNTLKAACLQNGISSPV